MRWPWVRRIEHDALTANYQWLQSAYERECVRVEECKRENLRLERAADDAVYKVSEYRRTLDKITWPLREPVICPNCRSVNLHSMRIGGGKSMWQCHDCQHYTHFYDENGTVKVVKRS